MKTAKPTSAQTSAGSSYVTHVTISVHTGQGTFFVVTLNQGPPISLQQTNNPTFDDHLVTALVGKESPNIAADADFLKQLEDGGFIYPFHKTSRRFPTKANMTVKKSVNSMKMSRTEINVKSFVFSLESDADKTVDEWCKTLTDLIVPALKKQDAARLRVGTLKKVPEYSPFVPGNNISVLLSENEYAPLDYAITDMDVSKYFEWVAKCTDGLVAEDGSLLETVEGSAWQLTIYERIASLRTGFYTSWENHGYNQLPLVKYGFPFSPSKTNPQYVEIGRRVEALTHAFQNLTNNDDRQQSANTYASALVSSLTTVLRTANPDAMNMVTYIQIRDWRVEMLNSRYVNAVTEQLQAFDSELVKYQIAFKDDPIKTEHTETVDTSATDEQQLKPAATGGRKRNDTSPETEQDTGKETKKNKTNISRQVTMPPNK